MLFLYAGCSVQLTVFSMFVPYVLVGGLLTPRAYFFTLSLAALLSIYINYIFSYAVFAVSEGYVSMARIQVHRCSTVLTYIMCVQNIHSYILVYLCVYLSE